MSGTETHRTAELPEEVLRGWRDLVEQDPHGSFFTTPDWVLSWWETLGSGTTAGSVTVWRGSDGRVEAVLPLLRTRVRLHPRAPFAVRCLTLLGTGPGAADHGGVPALPGRRPEIRAHLAELARRHTLWLPDLDPGAEDLLPPGSRPVARSSCPRADLTAGPDALGSRQFRSTVRRYGRKLAAAGITFRWVAPKQATPEILDAVLALHRLRRDSMGRPTTFDTTRRPLHARLIERCAGPGPERGPAFLLAEHGDRVVGGLYGFRWADTFAYFQIGWDPAHAPLRLGTALIDEAVRACADQGLATFDFLRGTEPYKYRFGATDRHDTTWLTPHGPSGVLLALKHHLKSR
ncbi:GNAT family N-acetyltransferase [Kitasatospora camelliae]|uniref:GNAT family N-acetyltransferase n=1 Tax=Kitasatospora camelliae TaxID=3156397 RepID=A0AAU8K4G2_9ACTN